MTIENEQFKNEKGIIKNGDVIAKEERLKQSVKQELLIKRLPRRPLGASRNDFKRIKPYAKIIMNPDLDYFMR